MTTLWCERAGGALRPADQESLDEFSKLPLGRPLKVEIKQPRNPQHHRLFFALCKRIADAKGITTDNVVDVLKIATGHCTIIRTKSYGELRLPKSISFANMDQQAFSEFFERCVRVIYEELRIPPEAVADLLVPQETWMMMK